MQRIGNKGLCHDSLWALRFYLQQVTLKDLEEQHS